MDGIAQTLVTAGSVLGVLLLIGSAYALVRASNQDARIKRLQDENSDYLSRLNYIEPRLVEAEATNALLKRLQNPTAALESISVKQDHTNELLVQQGERLSEMSARLHQPREQQP